jgi:hypothetical protein
LTTIGIPMYVTVNAIKNPKINRIQSDIENEEKFIGKAEGTDLKIM